MAESFHSPKTDNQKKLLDEQDIFIHFNMGDPAGIMFYEKVFEIAHQSLENFINKSNLDWKSWFSNSEWAVPIVHCEALFKSPIFCGKPAKVFVFLKSQSQHSLSFCYQIEQGELLCSKVETSHVFISKSESKKIPVPTEIVNIISN